MEKSWKTGGDPRVFRVCFQSGWITPVMARRHPAGGMVFHGLASVGEHGDGFLSSKAFHDFSTIFPRFVSRNMKNHHISRRMKNGDFELKSGAPGGTRTHDPLLRRQMLYPAELPEQVFYSVDLLLYAAIRDSPRLRPCGIGKICEPRTGCSVQRRRKRNSCLI